MDLKRLRTFMHVADLGSLSRAAERLHLSQPALSRQIKLLEEEVGEALLKRTGRGVEITEAGQVLAGRASRILSEVERLHADMADYKGRIRGQVVFGLPPSAGLFVGGPLIERYRAAYPEVKIRVVQMMSGNVQDALLKGTLDLGIIYEGSTTRPLRLDRLWAEKLYLVGNPESGVVENVPVSFDEICRYPLVVSAPRHGVRNILERQAIKSETSLNVAVESDSLSMILELTRRGLGVSVLPLVACQDDLEKGSLIAAPIEKPKLERISSLAWARDFPLSPAAAAMAEMIREFARQRLK